MATKKKRTSFPARTLALYDAVIATVGGLERKGATVPYTSLNGHMTSYLAKDGTLALRLPKGMIEEFLIKYKTTLCEAYGVVQKEYVVVPDALLKNTKKLKQYFAASYAYVAGMKQKATKKV